MIPRIFHAYFFLLSSHTHPTPGLDMLSWSSYEFQVDTAGSVFLSTYSLLGELVDSLLGAGATRLEHIHDALLIGHESAHLTNDFADQSHALSLVLLQKDHKWRINIRLQKPAYATYTHTIYVIQFGPWLPLFIEDLLYPDIPYIFLILSTSLLDHFHCLATFHTSSTTLFNPSATVL